MSRDLQDSNQTSNTQANGKMRRVMAAICNTYFTRFVLFLKHCDFSSGITNLRPTYGTVAKRLKLNSFCFKNIDGPPAKFLGKQVQGSDNYNKITKPQSVADIKYTGH